MGRRHGVRKGIARGCHCYAKGSCFTTYDAAMSAVTRVPDAERAYRGGCCGHYHITRSTQDEYAQRVAEFAGDDVPAQPSPLHVAAVAARRGVQEHESMVG